VYTTTSESDFDQQPVSHNEQIAANTNKRPQDAVGNGGWGALWARQRVGAVPSRWRIRRHTNPKRKRGRLAFLPRSRFGLILAVNMRGSLRADFEADFANRCVARLLVMRFILRQFDIDPQDVARQQLARDIEFRRDLVGDRTERLVI
jgi:hypothetical protein